VFVSVGNMGVEEGEKEEEPEAFEVLEVLGEEETEGMKSEGVGEIVFVAVREVLKVREIEEEGVEVPPLGEMLGAGVNEAETV